MSTWDSEIDEVANRRTDGEPEHGFSRRVLQRMQSGDRRPAGVRLAWRWFPVAAAVVLGFGVLLVRLPWQHQTSRPAPAALPGPSRLSPGARPNSQGASTRAAAPTALTDREPSSGAPLGAPAPA